VQCHLTVEKCARAVTRCHGASVQSYLTFVQCHLTVEKCAHAPTRCHGASDFYGLRVRKWTRL
jgi:hypothetical protein